MRLQEAIEPPEPAGLRLIAITSRLHQRDVVAHEVAENTAERWELP